MIAAAWYNLRLLKQKGESGKPIADVNATQLAQHVTSNSDYFQQKIKKLNTDYENGLISDQEMEVQRENIMNELDRNMEEAKRNLGVAKYLVSEAPLFSEPTDQATANSWHVLTEKTVAILFD